MISFCEDAAGQDIFGLNGHQIKLRDLSSPGEKAVGLAQACAIQRVAHAAGVGKAGLLHAFLQVDFKRLLRLRAKTIHILREHQLGDGE